MPTSTFAEKLNKAAIRNRSLLCIGLDPVPERMPLTSLSAFTTAIIEATSDLVCAYKPNMAFYERFGIEGLQALEQTLRAIPSGVVTIADAKRGDVGNTAEAYASALLSHWGFDAVTVSPYLGRDSIEPFLSYREKGIFVLCRTSNPGAHDFQDLQVESQEGRQPLYLHIASKALEWDSYYHNVGLVVGATATEELAEVRSRCPDVPILIPGVGPQGGDLVKSVEVGTDAQGRGAIVNISRQVLYASSDPATFQSAAHNMAFEVRETINTVLARIGKGW